MNTLGLSIPTAALYGLPIAVLWVTRARRDRSMFEFALDVPLAVSLDLLVTLAAAAFVLLGNAAVLVRVGWMTYGVARVLWRYRHGDRPRWPASMNLRSTATALAAAAACTSLSLLISRDYTIWDRQWHIPLVASLRGQSIPFHNVFQPNYVLHYHFTGDVLAAQLQAFSHCRLNASAALSLAHDLSFGLIGLTFALILQGFGARNAVAVIGGALALLLSGPFTLWRNVVDFRGQSYLNYLQMSFRPHVSLAGLLLVGCVGALAIGGHASAPGGVARSRTLVPFLLSGLTLSITDEPSLALVGLSAGAMWLIRPKAIHPRRLQGLAWLVALGVGALAVNYAFRASLAPGGPAERMVVTDLALPIYGEAQRWSFHAAAARKAFFFDFLEMLAAFVAIVWASGSRLVRAPAGSVVLAVTMTAASLVAFTMIALKNAPAEEAHRFVTAPAFVMPMLSMWILAAAPQGALPAALMQVGLWAGATSSLTWALISLPATAPTNSSFSAQDLYGVDCRKATSARLGERATPRYIDESIWYVWAGCRPSFAPGTQGSQRWSLKTDGPSHGLEALRELDDSSGDGVFAMACPLHVELADAVCAFALTHHQCIPSGNLAKRCWMNSSDRQLVLAQPIGAK